MSTYIGNLFLEAFLVIDFLQRPRVQAGHFDWAILTYENIHRSYISDFPSSAMEFLGSG